MAKKNRNFGLEFMLKTTVGTLIGAGVGYIANETDCVSYLIEYFGGKAGSADSVAEFGIPTLLGFFGGYYEFFRSIIRRYEKIHRLDQENNKPDL